MYPIFENHRWGLIDTTGKVVLPPRFEAIGRYGGKSKGPWPEGYLPSVIEVSIELRSGRSVTDRVIPIRLDGKAGFATRDGQVLALGRHEETGFRFDEGRVPVRSGGRYGFADERGAPVIAPQFDLVKLFDHGFAFVKADGRWGVVDREGRLVVPPTWDEVSDFPGDEWATVRAGDRWGVIDRSGKVILPLRFEEIGRPVGPLIFARENGRSVYVRPDGTVAFELTCPRKLFGAPKAKGFPFFVKSAIFRCGNRYGLVDTEGKVLLEPTWDHFHPFYDGRAIVKSGGKTGVVDERGRFVVEPGHRNIFSYSDSVAIISEPGPKFGLLDWDGRVIAEPSFEGLSECKEGLCIARSGGKMGYVDATGRWVIEPRFSYATWFRGPLAVVEEPVGTDAREFAYIDKRGNVVYRMVLVGFVNPPQRGGP